GRSKQAWRIELPAEKTSWPLGYALTFLSPLSLIALICFRSAGRLLWRVRVSCGCLAQGSFQRPEPRFVMPPVIDPLAEDRLADLLRARGAHGAVVFMEAQA